MLALGIEFRFFCTEVFRWSTINAYIGKINPVVWYLNGTDQDEFSLTYATGFSFISAKLFLKIAFIIALMISYTNTPPQIDFSIHNFKLWDLITLNYHQVPGNYPLIRFQIISLYLSQGCLTSCKKIRKNIKAFSSYTALKNTAIWLVEPFLPKISKIRILPDMWPLPTDLLHYGPHFI